MSEMVVSSSALAMPDGVAPGWLRVRDGLIVEPRGASRRCARRPAPDGDPGAGIRRSPRPRRGRGAVNCDDRARARDGVRSMAAFHARHGTTALLATTVSDTPERTLEAPAPLGRCGRARRWRPGDRRPPRGPLDLAEAAGRARSGGRQGIDPGELEALPARPPARSRWSRSPPSCRGPARSSPGCARAASSSRSGTPTRTSDRPREPSPSARATSPTSSTRCRPWGTAPGPVGAALTRDDVSVELVADGHHVHPSVIKLVFRLSARPVLVTDAIPATGAGDGPHRLGAREVLVSDGRAALADDPSVLAGSTLTMDRAVRTAVDAGVDLAAASARRP